MAAYKNGEITREKIINSAKKLFREKGYIDVKITDICKDAEISPGNFTYYFKHKNNLINTIYTDYLVRNFTYITKNFPLIKSSVLINICAITLYYRGFIVDEGARRFHYEVLQDTSVGFMYSDLRRLYWQFPHEFGVEISDEDYQLMANADIGVRRELFLKFVESNDTEYEKLVRNIYKVTGKLFSCPENTINEYINTAFTLTRDIDTSEIQLL